MGIIERMEASTVRHKADRAEHRASKLAETKPEKAASLRESADRLRHYAADLRVKDEEQKAAKARATEAKGAAIMEAAQAKEAARADLAAFRASHPLEVQMNKAAMMHLWPKAIHGSFPAGPVRGAHAELFDAHARQRHASGTATGQINIQLANGTVLSHGVKQQDLRMASRYVMALNAYAEQLAAEGK